MENRNIEINFSDYVNNMNSCCNFEEIYYNIGKFIDENNILCKSIRDFGSLALTVLSKLILPKFVSTPLTFLASYVAIDQFIINCKKYYVKKKYENLSNVNNDLDNLLEMGKINHREASFAS